MQYPFLFHLLLLAILTACSKEPAKPPVEYQVLEYGSTIPVEGVKVDAYKCIERESMFDICKKETYVSTSTTNSNGIVSFPASAEIAIIKVSKPGYWSRTHQLTILSDNSTTLQPIAIMKVRFIKTNSYAANNKLYVMSNTGACWECKVDEVLLGQPLDTTIYLKGEGNSSNYVTSFMWDGASRKDNSSSPVFINRFDTAQIEIRY